MKRPFTQDLAVQRYNYFCKAMVPTTNKEMTNTKKKKSLA